MKVKGLVLLSGGLDSILAVKILQDQGIDIEAISLKSYFFDSVQAEKAARKLGISLNIVDFSDEHLNIVKNPVYGYGKGMNPCIDCHILMLKKARKWAIEYGFDFVVTGDVLMERPMSQNPRAFKIIEKDSLLEGYLLRPLSAKLLEPTIPEKEGKLNRSGFFGISGRSRKKQIELAKKFKIDWFPMPAGGCLLTDLEFARRLKALFQIFPQCQGDDIETLKIGRHFWIDKIKIIVGRNEGENLIIAKLAKQGDVLIEMENYFGPLSLIRNYSREKIPDSVLKRAKFLTQYYSTKARPENDVKFKVNLVSKNFNSNF